MLSRSLMARLWMGVCLISGSVTIVDAASVSYAVVESKSTVNVHVGKSGAFSFAGHKHEVQAPVTGTVIADAANLTGSNVELVFATARMRVLSEGEPKGDAPKVEEVMHGPKALDVLRFPEVRFKSKSVGGSASASGSYELSLIGELSLHGVTKEITVRVKVTIEGRALTAIGETTLRHDQFGMERVSAGGGAVKVANDIGVAFKIVAEQR